MTEQALSDDCGPHCGVSNKHVGHCTKCHKGYGFTRKGTHSRKLVKS